MESHSELSKKLQKIKNKYETRLRSLEKKAQRYVTKYNDMLYEKNLLEESYRETVASVKEQFNCEIKLKAQNELLKEV